MRENDGHLDPAARPQHFQRDVIAMAANPQIDAGGAELQITQHHLVEKRRKTGLRSRIIAALDVDWSPSAFQQREWVALAMPVRAGDG